ncbi:amidohydrolase family protein [Microbacterium sp. SD291]|uniref:amidohydrolase family protein n=1 Tax=Microbacterium sp. SD291 TaxID=2782007 RepID=UPI001A975BB2|nr:amidohydrolase family protein [Microbacterium sp. SD291]MBO0980095.1 amidohydrolase family protein [Microbacterium sp. SD291]
MSLLIRAGAVVPATGGVVLERGGVVVSRGRILDVLDARAAAQPFDGRIVEEPDGVVMPGLVNIHTHGVSPSPLFPSGSPALSEERWRANLDRHLETGTTTVLSTCGLGTMEDIAEADRRHPVHVRAATAHTPSALAAARAADGAGLSERHALMTVERMLESGAVAIGELGGGQTLGGGGQDLVFLPAAILARTGRTISQAQARSLKESVLGRFMNERSYRPEALRAAAESSGLADVATEELRELILKTVMPSVGHARHGIREGIELARMLGVPALVHSASASAELIRDLIAERGRPTTIIAGHVNHTSHSADEAVELAIAGMEAGWYAEASVFDLLEGRETVQTRDHWDALLSRPGLVDALATDYGHDGRHDPLIAAVQDVIDAGHRSLAEAVEMVTSVPASLIPGLAEGGAMLRAGAPADIVIARRGDLRDVRRVFVGGEEVVVDGRRATEVRACEG